MLETLTGRLQEIFRGLGRRGHLSEADIDAALREVRMALLEADVHFSVAKDFLARVRTRAIGAEVSRALNPAQQVIQIVHEELIATLGEQEPWRLTGAKPRVMLLAGLQGSGKTTTAAKLARKLRNDGERVLLVAADIRRPAAVRQLQVLGEKVGVQVFTGPDDPVAICRNAMELARKESDSVVILDTAGRLQIDDELMGELGRIVAVTQPVERLLVADAMTGQEAVRIASGFHQAIDITGLILTKMDGDARGGAAISMRAVAGVPIRWIGTGEGIDALDEYDPARLAGRILGMGDMLGLIRKAEETFNREEAERQAEKVGQGEFTLEDLVGQMRQIRKMGPMGQWLDMLPGASQARITPEQEQAAEGDMKRFEAILLSMTPLERRNPEILNGSRKRRIARGSGTEVQEVNRLIKQFREAQKIFKAMSKGGGKGLDRFLRYNMRPGA
jgi:signal recognition particle subunit SRP54